MSIAELLQQYRQLNQQADQAYIKEDPRHAQQVSILLGKMNAYLYCIGWLERFQANKIDVQYIRRWARRYQGSYARSALRKICNHDYGYANAEIFKEFAETLKSVS